MTIASLVNGKLTSNSSLDQQPHAGSPSNVATFCCCSDKCLNQYKMNIFCKETQAHLQMHPHLQDGAGNGGSGSTGGLITPELWLRDCRADSPVSDRSLSPPTPSAATTTPAPTTLPPRSVSSPPLPAPPPPPPDTPTAEQKDTSCDEPGVSAGEGVEHL